MGCHVIARRKFCVGIGFAGDAHTHTDQISQFFTTQAHTAAGKAKVGDTTSYEYRAALDRAGTYLN